MSPVWVSIVMKDNEVLIAHIAKDKDKAAQETTTHFPNVPNLIFDLTDKRACDKISNWLAESDILGADNLEIVRAIGEQMDRVLEKLGL